MRPHSIYSTIIDLFAGLPSKAIFRKTKVEPASTDDQFYNSRCPYCWDNYSGQHSAARILPCGHVFGRDCVYEMVNGPTGDFCPLCRTKLFRDDITLTVFARFLSFSAISLNAKYIKLVEWLFLRSHKMAKHVPLQLQQPLAHILEYPCLLPTIYVQYCTDICTRNPHLDLRWAFAGTKLSCTLKNAVFYAPLLCLTYFVFGFRISKDLFIVLDTLTAGFYQYYVWILAAERQFDHAADRATVAHVAVAAFTVKKILLVYILHSWSENDFYMLGTAWSMLATVAWR